jgi:hypothetical protein
MPARYEAIKRSMVAKGFGDASAKTHAAKIFNASRKKGEAAVTGKHHEKKGKG